MSKINILEVFAEVPVIIGEIATINAEIVADLPAQSPGVEASIEGHHGKLSLLWTPDHPAQAAPAGETASTTEGTSTAQ